MSKLLLLAAVSTLTLAAGCASDVSLADEPGFVAGYGDGCSTAQEQDKSFSTKRVRDDGQFDADRAYRAGFRQGWQQCADPNGRASDGGLVLGDQESRF